MFDNATKFFEIPLICPNEEGNNITSHSIIVDVIGDITSVCVRVGDPFENKKEFLCGFWSHGWYNETKTKLPFCDEMNKLIEEKIAHMIHRHFDHDEIQKLTTLMILKKTILTPNIDQQNYQHYIKSCLYAILLNDTLYLKSSSGVFLGMYKDNQFTKLYDFQQDTDESIYFGVIEKFQHVSNPFDIRNLYSFGFLNTALVAKNV